MEAPQVEAAVGAAKSIAAAVGLDVAEAVVLHNSNRLAVRLAPCDVLARIAPIEHRAVEEFEVEVALRLAATASPVGALEPRVEPRVYVRDGFAVTLWVYYEPVSPRDIAPAEYAQALERLHAGMRAAILTADLAVPHFTDRVAEAQELVGDRLLTPELGDADREMLGGAFRELSASILERGAPEQLLHGEPHPGNLLRTKHGLLFIDLQTCCRGPVEFDLAGAPPAVGEHYPGFDRELLGECTTLALAMVAAWRWDRDDQFPNGREMGIELTRQVRDAMRRHRLGGSTG